jgi:hypothetical protein
MRTASTSHLEAKDVFNGEDMSKSGFGRMRYKPKVAANEGRGEEAARLWNKPYDDA